MKPTSWATSTVSSMDRPDSGMASRAARSLSAGCRARVRTKCRAASRRALPVWAPGWASTVRSAGVRASPRDSARWRYSSARACTPLTRHCSLASTRRSARDRLSARPSPSSRSSQAWVAMATLSRWRRVAKTGDWSVRPARRSMVSLAVVMVISGLVCQGPHAGFGVGGRPFAAVELGLGIGLQLGVVVFQVLAVEQRGQALGQLARAVADGGDIARHRAVRQRGRIAKAVHMVQAGQGAGRLFLELEQRAQVGRVRQFLVLGTRLRHEAVAPDAHMGRQVGELGPLAPADAKAAG